MPQTVDTREPVVGRTERHRLFDSDRSTDRLPDSTPGLPFGPWTSRHDVHRRITVYKGIAPRSASAGALPH